MINHAGKIMKQFKALLLSLTLLFIITGCANDEPKGMSDAELVQAIIDAENKTEVSMEDLPTVAMGTMEENYLDEYLHLHSLKASMLGYEVSIAGRAANAGKRGEVYFNIDGRKLDPNDYNDDYKDWYGERGDFDKDEFGEKRDWNCFEIVHPYTIMMPNGTSYTIDSDQDIDLDEIKRYYEENQGVDEKPALVFPVNILGYDGETEAINNEEEMKNAYRECSVRDRDRDWDRRECFELVFPVTYIMPDGSTYEISSDEDESGWEELKEWYDSNPDSDQRPELQYPVDIITWENEESVIITINSEEEMIAAKEECREMWSGESDGDDGASCYAFVYPISYTMPDGSVIEITTDEDESGWLAIREYYQSNPSEESEPSLQYPVDLIFRTEDGTETVTVSSDDDLDAVEEERCQRPS
jgi:hypothetical protein